MYWFSFRSLAIGLILGLAIGAGGLFALFTLRAGQEKVDLSSAQVTLDGAPVTLAQAPDDGLYIPARELFEHMGYTATWDAEVNTLHLEKQPVAFELSKEGDPDADADSVGMMFKNDYFRVKAGQTLVLRVQSSLQSGSVDLILTGPDGTEQQIAIGSSGFTQELALSEGEWGYTCSGQFPASDSVYILATLRG